MTSNDVIPSTSQYLYGTITTPTSSSRVSGSGASKLLKPQYSFNKDTYESTSTTGGLTGTGTSLLYDDSTLPSSSTMVSSVSDNGPGSLVGSSATSSTTRRPHKYSKYQGSGAASQSGGSKTERIISKSSKSSPNLLSKDRDYDHFYTTADRYDPSKYLNSGSSTTSGTSSSGYNSAYLNNLHHHSTHHPYSHSNLNQYLTSGSSSTSGKNYGSGTTGSGSSTSSYYQPSHHYLNNLGKFCF